MVINLGCHACRYRGCLACGRLVRANFRSLGRGHVPFEEVMRALNRIAYRGPLSVEWEDSGMDREHGAEEACDFVHSIDFPTSASEFDAAFSEG